MFSVKVTVTVTSNRFAELAAKLPALAGEAVRKAGLDIVTYAKMAAPVDTGYLRNSITFQSQSATSGLVYVGAEYGIYQEYGTRKMPAHPYFTPAVEAVRPQFEAAVAAALKGLA